MTPTTLAALAVAGNRTDRLRTFLTVISAALAVLALLSANSVAWIDPFNPHYSSPLLAESGLRPGVVMALILLSLPVLALAGQCIRLGAPARDRRLAAIRLAGATPGQAVLIATAETAAASLLGSGGGLLAWLVARSVLERRDKSGQLTLPTDVRPPYLLLAAVLLGVPLVAALIGGLLMRRVILTPLGVVRRVRDRGPKPWPGVLIAVGLVLFWLPQVINVDNAPKSLFYLFLGGGLASTMGGVVLGTGWISYTAGRLLRRHGRGAATLLAGKQLLTDPWNGSRTMAALLAAMIAGAVALGYRANLITELAVSDRFNALTNDPNGGDGLGAEPSFYFGAIRLVLVAIGVAAAVAAAGVLVALAESIVARRRSYAAMTATGVPRRTLSAAVAWHTLTPLIPALVLALAAGSAVARLQFGTQIEAGGDSQSCVSSQLDGCQTNQEQVPLVTGHVPVPYGPLVILGLGALLAVLIAVGVSVVVLRSSTDLDELRAG